MPQTHTDTHTTTTTLPPRVLIHLADGRRIPVDPREVYLLDAEGGETRVRLRSKRALIDVRQLGEISPIFEKHGFVRIHRAFTINPARVREIRPRDGARGWEVKMDAPVNRVLPVGRDAAKRLWAAFGE